VQVNIQGFWPIDISRQRVEIADISRLKIIEEKSILGVYRNLKRVYILTMITNNKATEGSKMTVQNQSLWPLRAGMTPDELLDLLMSGRATVTDCNAIHKTLDAIDGDNYFDSLLEILAGYEDAYTDQDGNCTL